MPAGVLDLPVIPCWLAKLLQCNHGCFMRLLALSALAFSLATPAVAAPIEQPFSGRRPLTLGVHAGFAWYGNGVAFGARLGVPLVHNGFVSTINNSVYLSVGADVYNADYGGSRGFAVGVPVALQWNFYFSEEWSAFVEAGVNLYFDDSGRDPYYYNWGIGAIGGRYKFSDTVAVQLRLGSPYSALGIVIDL